MPLYELMPFAEADVDQIFDYIAQDNLVYAFRWLKKIYYNFDLLSRHPLAGTLRKEFNKEVRFWSTGHYLILYHPTTPIKIARVLSCYRDLNLLLR